MEIKKELSIKLFLHREESQGHNVNVLVSCDGCLFVVRIHYANTGTPKRERFTALTVYFESELTAKLYTGCGAMRIESLFPVLAEIENRKQWILEGHLRGSLKDRGY